MSLFSNCMPFVCLQQFIDTMTFSRLFMIFSTAIQTSLLYSESARKPLLTPTTRVSKRIFFIARFHLSLSLEGIIKIIEERYLLRTERNEGESQNTPRSHHFSS